MKSAFILRPFHHRSPDARFIIQLLGLHVAGNAMGAQFYPNCVQVTITNGGSVQLPTGIALPGAYDPQDTKGVLVELWKIQQTPTPGYTAPGGPVLLPWVLSFFNLGA